MNRFHNILYVSNPTVVQDAALARAVSLAENNQANLTVAEVVPVVTGGLAMPPGGPVSTDLQAALEAEHRQALESLVASHRRRANVRIEVLAGHLFVEVIRAVLGDGYDLVIKPADDPDWLERLFSSDDMHLLRKCPCPVWLTKSPEKANYGCIVAAVDFDPARSDAVVQELNRHIVTLASSLALSDFAELHLVHAWDVPEVGFIRSWADHPAELETQVTENALAGHRRGMDGIKQMLSGHLGREAFDYLAPRFHVSRGPALHVVPDLARRLEADLVVMGTVGRTGIPGFIIGNTAEGILDQLTCSVLAVKPPGFVSPLKAP